MTTSRATAPHAVHSRHGSVLVIVLWVTFGVVALALYFCNATGLELRATDNRTAALEADHAIDGAIRYAVSLLGSQTTPGTPTDPLTFAYVAEAVPVGNGSFWFLGRDPATDTPIRPMFALVDESARLNINLATAEMLELLPRMTPELAAAIVDWRDEDSDISQGGAEDETYLRRTPPYRCKNAPFETVEELRMVAGMDLDLLYGEDTNLNGILDPNEDDGDLTPPVDNRDGRLDPGLLEYITVHSREGTNRVDGTARVSVGPQGRQELAALLEERIGQARANEVLGRLTGPNANPDSLLQFYTASGMAQSEFEGVEADLIAGDPGAERLVVNVNTASAAVLACLPGIGFDNAAALVARRQSNPAGTVTVAWVTEVLDAQAVQQAGPFLTGRGYQTTVDVAALGHHGRGYRRVRAVIDSSAGSPRVVARTDLTRLGWALGRDVRLQRELLFSSNQTP